MGDLRADYDNPWKEAIERYFEEFMLLLFPKIHKHIDWMKAPTFLDKELQQVVRDAETGERRVDKLVRVWRKDGHETWILIHIEVQSQYELDFGKRMYIYHYRLFDRYERQIVNLGVLADMQTGWRPSSYDYSLWGCEMNFRFPIVKLLDYEEKWEDLEANENPFAVFVMTHLKAIRTQKDFEDRLRWKLRLVKMLYKKGYDKQTILELFRFIDWLLVLPEDLENSFEQTLTKYEEEKKMSYITSIERIGIRKGIEQGIQRGIEQGIQRGIQQGVLQEAQEAVIDILEVRFGEVLPLLVSKIHNIHDTSLLRKLLKQAVLVDSLDEFERMLSSKN